MSIIIKRVTAILSVAVLIAGLIPFMIGEEAYGASIRLNKKSLYMAKGTKAKLKVKGTKAKVKWSSTNKKVAVVTKKGVVRARKPGSAKIKAKVKGKTLVCKVKVDKAAKFNAVQLRKYVLKHGKNGAGGKKILKTKWTDIEDSTCTFTITAYTFKKLVVFKWHVKGEYVSDYEMEINLIAGKPGKVKAYNIANAEKTSYEGKIGYNYYEDIDTGVIKDLVVYKYEYQNGNETPETYEDAKGLKDEGMIAGFSLQTQYALDAFDEGMKKLKTKKTMKKLGFRKL